MDLFSIMIDRQQPYVPPSEFKLLFEQLTPLSLGSYVNFRYFFDSIIMINGGVFYRDILGDLLPIAVSGWGHGKLTVNEIALATIMRPDALIGHTLFDEENHRTLNMIRCAGVRRIWCTGSVFGFGKEQKVLHLYCYDDGRWNLDITDMSEMQECLNPLAEPNHNYRRRRKLKVSKS